MKISRKDRISWGNFKVILKKSGSWTVGQLDGWAVGNG
jgi:hypothetical protein